MNTKMPDQDHPKINWELFIFGLLLTAFSFYMSYAVFLSHQKQSDASANFVVVKARVLESQVIQPDARTKTTSGNNQVYLLGIHYEYEVNGQTYQSKKFNFSGKGYTRSKDATRVIRYYPVGSMQSAYYNPDNPAEAVLQKSKSSSISSSILFPVLCVLGGLLCIFTGWKGSLHGLSKN
jgi:uncharacterized protein DUF3592